MKFKALYRIGKTKHEFSKLDLVDKSGKERTEIQGFFEEHLENIFPELQLLV